MTFMLFFSKSDFLDLTFDLFLLCSRSTFGSEIRRATEYHSLIAESIFKVACIVDSLYSARFCKVRTAHKKKRQSKDKKSRL